jgi:hypothetical protein
MAMADKDNDASDLERFGWSPGELSVVEEDGTLTRIGEIPLEVQREIAQREQNQRQAEDAAKPPAPRKTPGVRIHIHRK